MLKNDKDILFISLSFFSFFLIKFWHFKEKEDEKLDPSWKNNLHAMDEQKKVY